MSICRDALNSPEATPLGVLTGDDRDEWAKACRVINVIC